MNTTQFYLGAWILMAVSVFGNLINIAMTWSISNLGVKIGLVSGMLFNILLFLLFISLWISESKTKIVENPELDKYLNELKSKEVNNAK